MSLIGAILLWLLGESLLSVVGWHPMSLIILFFAVLTVVLLVSAFSSLDSGDHSDTEVVDDESELPHDESESSQSNTSEVTVSIPEKEDEISSSRGLSDEAYARYQDSDAMADHQGFERNR